MSTFIKIKEEKVDKEPPSGGESVTVPASTTSTPRSTPVPVSGGQGPSAAVEGVIPFEKRFVWRLS